jgi:DUF1680 family protein
VNLYTPSTVRFQANGKPVVLRQETNFPEAPKVSFIVQCDQPAQFTLKLRKPGWLVSPVVALLNGAPVELATDKLHWFTIQRTWQSGDRLEIRFPMSPAVRQLHSERPRHFAVSVGPVVLAAAADRNPSAMQTPDQFVQSLQPVPSEPLTYRVAGAPKVILKPFYKFSAGEQYFLYMPGRLPGTP